MADTDIDENIRETVFGDALGERYLNYALSTIMHRALPDVRDGLKPVHRRLLYAMRQLKLDPNTGYKKSARVVGDVIGKYHPHGDQSVYDALVRLAQDFAVRFPLIDGQGNFGNVDGDNAAAMRYTEARLTEVAAALLDGIDEDTVDFRATYDGEESEPAVLPASFPNLLANGSSGIAVGMATNIPPHNVGELCDALLHLIKTPNARVETLVEKYVKGPDFPTGGIIIEPQESIVEAYRTGRGGFRLRAKWEKEDAGRGTWRIIVTEIPYQVQKSKLIEKVAELIQNRKLPLLADVVDESAEEIRLVLEPKSKNVDPEVLMEHMFKLTDLETRISLNMNVLDASQTPRVMSLAEVLWSFLEHRKVVLIRRSNYRLDKIEKRLNVLSGYLIAYLNLDEVIRIIREEDHPKKELMAAFDLNEEQAEAILNMRLRSLRKLEEMEIRKEHDELSDEKTGLLALLKSDDQQWASISDEIKEIKKQFGVKSGLGKRRSELADAPDVEDIPLESMIEKEPITVVCSEKGWIRAMKGHLEPGTEVKFKDGDREKFQFHAMTTDKLLVFATNGRFYTLACDRLPGGRGHGEPIRLMIDLGNDQDLADVFVHQPGRRLIVASSDGRGFVVEENSVLASTKNGKQVLNVSNDVEAAVCREAKGDTVAVIGENRKLLVFPLEELPEMNRGRGIVLQKYKDGGLSDVCTFTLDEGLSWLDAAGRSFNVSKGDLSEWIGKRAQAGRMPPKGFPRSNKFG